MEWLHFRESASTWSHAVGLLLALPATVSLLRASRGNLLKQFAFLIYGLSLAACYGGSTLYHGVRTSSGGLALFATLDYIGIFLLIAGTSTPPALVVLRGSWQWGTLTGIWLLAAVGISLRLTVVQMPLLVSTGLYLAMGWGMFVCYFELIRVLTPRGIRLLLLGGLLYSIGALFNVLHWPALWPGVFAAHEVFHLFVLAGSAVHFWFMLTVVAPFTRPALVSVPHRTKLTPAPAFRQTLRPSTAEPTA